VRADFASASGWGWADESKAPMSELAKPKTETNVSKVSMLATSLVVLLHVYSFAQTRPGSRRAAAAMREEFSFVIPDFKVDHQSEINNLTIRVRYLYSRNLPDTAYPDFIPIAADIKDFLTNYPNKTDYWEVVNKRLTLAILRKYRLLSRLTVGMEISPATREPYLRTSTVTCTRAGLHHRAAGRERKPAHN
jgi:hypothetical protein